MRKIYLLQLRSASFIHMQSEDKTLKDYKNQEIIYIPRNIVKEFVKEFYRNFMQRYTGVIGLVVRLQEEYIVYRVQKIAKEVIGECLDC